MTTRSRLVAFAACVIVVVVAASAYAVHDRSNYEAVHSRPPVVPSATAPVTGPRIVFRHTGLDNHYGLVATVPLSDPGGPRAFTDLACDRVYATAKDASCLQVKRGVTTKYDLLQLDRNWNVVEQNALPGIPSRTRLSPDGRLVADTTFVSGHSYMQIGFSTATEIRHFDGTSYGNLEQFKLVINGKTVDPVDRNVWGVTFATDDNTFYATVGTGGKTYLVKGSLTDRTLTSIHENAECPSLSPDGTHIAYKVNVGHGSTTFWTPAVLDLSTGAQTLLSGESRNIDDQVEWLDGHTLLYGVPRTDQAGVEDVWSIRTDASAKPQLLIKEAWSPAVIR